MPAAPAAPRAGLAALALVLAAALLPGAAISADAARPASPAAEAAIEVASGVYMIEGAPGEVGPQNLGRVGNAAFIVGAAGVIAIDSGTSYRHGVALLEAIGRVTAQPVRLLLLTQARQEFVFGAAAFRERGIPIRMHAEAARLMAARCGGCLARLERELGGEMRGTALLAPDATFDSSHAIETVGRAVRVLTFGHSSGPGDVAVLDERTGTLIAGGLVAHARLPDLQDADPEGWRRALAALEALRPARIVPGHGPLAPAGAIGDTRRYLDALEARMRAAVDDGASLAQAPELAAMPQLADRDGYPWVHRRNAAALYLRLERESMSRPPPR